MIKTILVLSDGTEIFAGHNRINAIQSTSIMESSNDGEDLTLGSVCAKKIEIKIITPKNKLPIKSGDLIMVYEEENGVRRKKGNFIAEKPQKKGANTTNIVAYDNISLLDKDVTEWFNSLEGFPYTAYDMAKKVCQYCGINFANANINNGDYLIYATQLKSVTARQIVRWIGEISGCFCVADENGNAVYQWYKENSTPIVASRSENAVTFLQGGLSYEDYQTNKVDRVQIRQDKNSVGIVFPNGASGENSYIIESNPFLIEDARMVDIAESLYNIIKDITYVPCKVNVPSSYKFNVGDIVKITDTNGVEFYSYIMQKKRAGQKETLECTGNYTRNGATTLYNTSYTAGYGRDLEISKDLAKLELTTSENESKISLIVQDDKASGSLIIGAINDESYAKINADRLDIEGKTLNIKVDAANITGTLTASQINTQGLKITDGELGGWNITTHYVKSTNEAVGLYSGNDDGVTLNTTDTSIIDGTKKSVRFFAGATNNTINTAPFRVLSDGSLYSTAGKFTNGLFDNCTINETCEIKGKLVGDTISSVRYGNTSGTIEFFTTTGGAYYNFEFDYDVFTAGVRLGMNGESEPSVYIYSEYSELTVGESIVATAMQDMTLSVLYGTGSLVGNWTGTLAASSDARKKRDVAEIPGSWEKIFDKLCARIYRYKDNEAGKLHFGFVAQELEAAIAETGQAPEAFAVLRKGKDGYYSIVYDEFIALCVLEIQKLKARVCELERG